MAESNKMRLAFIQPNTKTLQGTSMPPFGLMYIAAVARKNNHYVRIFDRNVDFFTYSKLKRYNPDLVGVSAFTGPGLKDVLEIVEHVKRILDVPIVMGGVHASCLPEQTLENPNIDYVIVGEGEESFIELLEAIHGEKYISEIPGIGYKQDGKINITTRRELIIDLDKLPFTPWDLVNTRKYFRYDIILITSRGCPGRCSFCYNINFNCAKWRGMSAERVIEEIKIIEDLTNNKNLGFHDDNFCADRPRLYKILKYLSADYKLFVETRVDYITEEFLEHFKKFKSVWFYLGAESGSQRILDKMRKGITVEQIIKAFDLCNKYGIKTTASIMFGCPTETPEELQESLDLLKRIKPTRYTYCLYTPYPGSPWYDEIVDGGMFDPPKSMKEWSNFAVEIRMANLDKANLSSVSSDYLRKLDDASWMKSLWEIIKAKEFHKIWLRVVNYEPFLIPVLNPIDKVVSKWR